VPGLWSVVSILTHIVLSFGHDVVTLATVVSGDHRALASGGDAALLIAIPILWLVGVAVFIALKLRAR
jgi:hypothetical protein